MWTSCSFGDQLRSACPLPGTVLSSGTRFIAEPQHKKRFDSERVRQVACLHHLVHCFRSFRGVVHKNVSSALRRCAGE